MSQAFNGPSIYGSVSGGSAPFSVTGTGLVKATAGVIDAAASLLVNADVDAAAAIAGTKIAPAFGAQLVTTSTGIALGAGSVTTTGLIRVPHNSTVLTGRDNADANDRSLITWGATADTLILAESSFAAQINPSTLTFGSATTLIHNVGGTTASSGNFRLGSTSWSMIARNNANTANCNIIRSNSTANALIFGDTVWGAVTLQGPGIQIISGGMSASIGSTGWIWTGSTALTSQVYWAATAVTPIIGVTQQADANTGEALTIRAQPGGSTGNQNGGALNLEGGPPSGSGTRGAVVITGGALTFTTPVAATATAGAGALPATPEEFLTVTVNGNARKIPLYLN